MRRFALIAALLLSGCIMPDFGPGPSPEPTPDVDPQPGKLMVLVIEETEDRGKPENRPYLGVLNSLAVRQYLNTHCREIDGEPAWRFVDDDDDLTKLPREFQKVANDRRGTLPWFAVSNGRRGTAGPLPKSEAEFLRVLKRWGGE